MSFMLLLQGGPVTSRRRFSSDALSPERAGVVKSLAGSPNTEDIGTVSVYAPQG